MTPASVFVIPFSKKLMAELQGQRLIVRTTRPEDILVIMETAQRFQGTLDAVILESSSPVTSLPFEEAWKTVPLLVRAPELGRVSHLLHHIPVIRGMSLRLMLPTEGKDNYASLRVLSSLGISSGFLLRGNTADWEQLLDLATYYYFNFMGHASIAPLDVLGDQYKPGEGAGFGSVYLEDAATIYYHINEEGEVALTEDELQRGDILYPSLATLGEGLVRGEELLKNYDWRRLFMSSGPCPTCPAMKLCRGRVAAEDGAVPEGCTAFFGELMDTIEEYQATKNGRRV